MRHLVAGRKLSRDTGARQALLANIAGDLIAKGHIKTTLARAKFAKPYVEKLITAAKQNKLSRNRILASKLSGDFAKLLTEVAPGFRARSGGYTRIVKIGRRLGDGALMARLELLPGDKKEKSATDDSAKSSVPSAVARKSKNEKSKS